MFTFCHVAFWNFNVCHWGFMWLRNCTWGFLEKSGVHIYSSFLTLMPFNKNLSNQSVCYGQTSWRWKELTKPSNMVVAASCFRKVIFFSREAGQHLRLLKMCKKTRYPFTFTFSSWATLCWFSSTRNKLSFGLVTWQNEDLALKFQFSAITFPKLDAFNVKRKLDLTASFEWLHLALKG